MWVLPHSKEILRGKGTSLELDVNIPRSTLFLSPSDIKKSPQ